MIKQKKITRKEVLIRIHKWLLAAVTRGERKSALQEREGGEDNPAPPSSLSERECRTYQRAVGMQRCQSAKGMRYCQVFSEDDNLIVM